MDIFIIDKNKVKVHDRKILERFQYKNFSDADKLKEHCLSYYLLDKILRDNYNVENRELEFISQKPYLKSREVHFSISHSRNFIAIAISSYNCGIDIEFIKERDFVKIARRMKFEECSSLDDFYKKWTEYEAAYKLNDEYKKIKHYNYENYMISAVSTNNNEIFQLII